MKVSELNRAALKRLESRWKDPDVTTAMIRDAFGFTKRDLPECVARFGPKPSPGAMPAYGTVRPLLPRGHVPKHGTLRRSA